jgi:4-amino-4-deoxy-L-arabinose transferase-like glycosyltransferase
MIARIIVLMRMAVSRSLFAGVLMLAAALRLWQLGRNGYGTEYYAAAVRSMLGGWRNFFYASFDPGGFVSVDKPPVALWLQVASAKLFGFHGLALIGPQVIEGLAAVAVLYALVRRRFGTPAGLLAALFLAITPINVAIDRSSNTDSCLVLVLLLAAWALLRAVEHGERRWLLLALALVGIGFNVKMMAAFVVLPTFVVVWLLGAPASRRRRLAGAAMGGLVLAVVSLTWVVLYDITPADRRPFAGGSRTNSMVQLAVGHNGLQRFVARERPAHPAAYPPRAGTSSVADSGAGSPGAPAPRRIVPGFGDRVPPGPLRLFHPDLAAQVAWLLPLALVGLVLGPGDARLRLPLAAVHVSLALWAGWLVTYGAVYSATRDIFHAYYLSTMGPPLAALAAVGTVTAWARYLRRDRAAWLLPVALVLTAAWQASIQAGAVLWKPATRPGRAIGMLLAVAGQFHDWRGWLTLALLGGGVLSAAALGAIVMKPLSTRGARATAAAALALGLVALSIAPAAWALSSVLSVGNLMLPSANLNRLVVAETIATARERAQAEAAVRSEKLVAFLRANRSGERFLFGVPSAPLAAPIIVRTGEPVMAIGGFHGEDPILTPESLAHLVAAKQVRFVLLPNAGGLGWRPGGEAANLAVAEWIRAQGMVVGPVLWRVDGASPTPPRGRVRIDSMQLYDLRPEAGLLMPDRLDFPAPLGFDPAEAASPSLALFTSYSLSCPRRIQTSQLHSF